jgi:hypothetical protein
MESEIAKTTPKAKNSAFMKPMQPSEHLAKIVGADFGEEIGHLSDDQGG